MATTHERKQLRDAVTAALKAAATSAGARVYSTRCIPLREKDLPAISVYTPEETDDDQQTAPREYKRKVRLVIEGIVEVGPEENADDAADALDLEIEVAMDPDPTFKGTCSDSVLKATSLEVGEKGRQLVGIVRKTYEATLYTDARMPAESTLDDLKTIDVHTRLGGTQPEADQANDLLNNLDAGAAP